MPTRRSCRAAVAAAVLAVSTASCGAGSSPGQIPPNPSGVPCNIGTQVQLSSPLPNARGVPANIGKIQIVVNANSDILGTAWNTYLADQFGNNLQGGTLTLTSNPNGPHPFPSDYYYNSTIPQLAVGRTYAVYVNQLTSACTPLLVNSFST